MQEEISFGVWLRKQRRALDLSQQAFADQVGCAEVTLRRIEAGTLKPSKELASILLEKLGIPKAEWPQWIAFARGISGLPTQSLPSSSKPKSDLPEPITAFIGQKKEQPEGTRLLTQPALVTFFPTLKAQLFGGFNLIYDNMAVTGVNSARLQALLAFLILHADSPQSRQQVAFLFWPDTTEAQARNNLRQFLFQLRQTLPDSDRFLKVDTNIIFWKTDEKQLVDVWLFKRATKDADLYNQRGDQSLQRVALEKAVAVYQGDLLPGCYEDWIELEREDLRLQSQNVHRKLIQILEIQREYALALTIGQHLLNLDPLDEGTYVTLMRLHALNDDLSGARRVYQNAVETLRHELDVEPNEVVRSTYQRLQHVSQAISAQGENNTPTIASFKLVGRQSEWQQLQAAWKRAAAGHAHLFLITGEAGIGKSRLAEELFSWVMRQGFATTYSRSYGVEGRLSLGPVIDLLRSGNIHSHIDSLDNVWITEIARLLPELLIEHPDLAHPTSISEHGQRQLFFEALARAIHASQHPLLLWIDDLHWADQETLEWLHFLLRFEPHDALLILGTARSEESPPEHPLSLIARQLRIEDKISVIELSPLDAAETAKLASEVKGHALEERDVIRLFRETEGNPLFVVETLRSQVAGSEAIEMNRTNPATSDDVQLPPPRVHAVIVGRLVQLSPQARKVAEIGAVIGRAFPLDLLLQAGHENEEAVVSALNELWQKRIIREKSVNSFDFTHDKLREVAYLEISAPQRRLLHRNVAQALEVIKADDLDAVSAQLATHYDQAGMLEQAIQYYQKAAKVAASIFANADAIRFLKNALALLPYIPDDLKRGRQELELQLALSTLHRIMSGWTSQEVESALNRALILSNIVSDDAQRIRTLFGLQLMYTVQARYENVEQAYAQAEILLMKTLGAVPPVYTAGIAIVKLYTGQIWEARKLFERIVSIRDNERLRDIQESFGYNYLVHEHGLNSQALWCLGYPQAALQSINAAEQLADEFGQPFNQVYAIAYRAMLEEWCADTDVFRARAEAAFVLASDHNFPYYITWSRILVNFARTCQEPDAEILMQLRDSINDFVESGAGVRLPYYFSLLARAYTKAGRLNEGLDALDHALKVAAQNNEHWWDAELHRLHGELKFLQGESIDEIEQVFRRAIDIAGSQTAKSLELRAATSLARLWHANSRSVEAKHVLVPLYEWFTEGFDTPDLQAARRLIAQL
ncbi:MAG TPA: AAA family ATPase [Anaerolineales bacterium]|nr:AAA family ATPase [Anaerolineales bacterium]